MGHFPIFDWKIRGGRGGDGPYREVACNVPHEELPTDPAAESGGDGAGGAGAAAAAESAYAGGGVDAACA